MKNCLGLAIRATHCGEIVCELAAKRVHRKNLKHNATASSWAGYNWRQTKICYYIVNPDVSGRLVG